MLDGILLSRPYLEVDAKRPDLLNDQLLAFTMSEREGCPVQVELLLENAALHDGAGMSFAFEHRDSECLPLGKPFRVLCPSADPEEDDRTPREIFSGRVSALEFRMEEAGQPQLMVIGEDALMAWRMRRRTRGFDAAPLREMLTKLAEGDALATPVIDDLTQKVATRFQVNDSDLSFLQRLLADHDADAQVVGGVLHIAPRASIRRGEVALELGPSLVSLRVVADLAHQRSMLSLSAYDHANGAPLFARMTTGILGPGSGRRAAEYLSAFGDTGEHLGGAPVTNDAEARALAEALGARRARRFVTAQGRAQGNPQLRVGTHLKLAGIGPRFTNSYYVTACCHRYDRNTGYVTDFEAECAYFNGEASP